MRKSIIGAAVFAGILGIALPAGAQRGGSGSGSGSGSVKSPGSEAGKVTEFTKIGGKVLKEWIDELRSGDPSIRDKAMRAILLYGSAATDTGGPALMKRLHDPDVGMKAKTILALSIINVPDKDIPKLAEILGGLLASDQEQQIVRYNAALVLAKLGSGARPALRNLVTASGDSQSWEIRKLCLFTLGEAASDRKNGPDILVINACMKGLIDSASEVRMEAATTLFTLGPPSDDRVKHNVIILLKQRFTAEKEPEATVWLCMAAIGIEGPTDAWVRQLTKYFKHEDPKVREQALAAAAMLGDQGKVIKGQINDALADKEVAVVQAAIDALANIHRKDEKVTYRDEWLQSLCRFFTDPNPVLREQGLVALGRYGENAKPCVSDVLKLLDDKEVQVVYTAINTLARIGVTSDDIIAKLNGVQRREDLTGRVADDVKNAAGQLVRIMKNGKKPS